MNTYQQQVQKTNKIPTFFTFFEAGDDANIQIPSAFSQIIDEPFPQKVILRDPNDRQWTVKMEEFGPYNWYFLDGWKKFVNDNSLATNDLLVFRYIHKDIFYVKIYDLDGTEKNVTVETDDDDNDDNREGVGGKNMVQRRRAPSLHPKCYGREIFEAGWAEKPINPYFVTKLRLKQRNSTVIPVYVINDYNLSLENEITLVDTEGREFQTKCSQWNDGRIMLTGGWAQLCRVNAVNEEQDTCICEFLQRQGDNRQFLNISFVRNV